MKDDKLVFCKDCMHLYEIKYMHGSYTDIHCEHPDNKKEDVTYYKRSLSRDKDPKVINKNNDCKWFEKKESLWKLFCEWFKYAFVRMPGRGPGQP